MSSATTSNLTNARTPLTPDELSQALEVEVYDHVGKTTKLRDLVNGKRTVLIFTRHYWCLNCQAYVRTISSSIPPSKLPPNIQILIINNGSWQPIDTYTKASSSAYPVYTDPTLKIHGVLKFNSALKEASAGDEKRDYMRDAGTTIGRVLGGIKGALGSLQHTAYIGPKALNGGEVVVSPDGECEFIYRMQNTVDHTNVEELAKVIGVEVSGAEGEGTK